MTADYKSMSDYLILPFYKDDWQHWKITSKTDPTFERVVDTDHLDGVLWEIGIYTPLKSEELSP